MVPRAGVEPARLAAPDFKSGMSTYSIIGAFAAGRDYNDLMMYTQLKFILFWRIRRVALHPDKRQKP